ncbi:hypothetical protein TSUD_355750 [Trifolium subterraneum]|uniref:F-box domain-containing protein n=1 Tax=Trifolium subterraneum TaxID=3900 RepID=A0A2Z6N6B0_TRISU|nr:hypothetical protein TSUD_355750 [Trifolium subterraneum]
MAESSKRQKPETLEEEMQDRISSLPDGVLSHILSFLPTKTTVQTSVLSNRWHHIWKHQSVLYFTEFTEDYHRYRDNRSEQFKSFVVLVNSVLNLLHNPRAIRKMTLLCFYTLLGDKFRQHSVESWVRSVIGPHLEELDLTFAKDYQGSDFKLPQTFFTSPNLVSLSLVGAISVQKLSSTTVCLPSLKKMIINIGFVEVSSVNALLSGCPIIETLNLCFCSISLDKVCVPSSLKKLKVALKNQRGAYLEINAPDLEYFQITKITFGEVFSMYNLHNVVEAHLDVFPHSLGSVTPLHNLLGALSGTKHLVLNPSTTKWLLGEPHDLLFQEFRYLVRLELYLARFNYNSLISLLQKCPVLRFLRIHNIGYKEQSPVLKWAPQRSVPSCLVSHLKFIQFQGFQGLQDELFIKYVLRNGLVLETMVVFDISLDQKKKGKVRSLNPQFIIFVLIPHKIKMTNIGFSLHY